MINALGGRGAGTTDKRSFLHLHAPNFFLLSWQISTKTHRPCHNRCPDRRPLGFAGKLKPPKCDSRSPQLHFVLSHPHANSHFNTFKKQESGCEKKMGGQTEKKPTSLSTQKGQPFHDCACLCVCVSAFFWSYCWRFRGEGGVTDTFVVVVDVRLRCSESHYYVVFYMSTYLLSQALRCTSIQETERDKCEYHIFTSPKGWCTYM